MLHYSHQEVKETLSYADNCLISYNKAENSKRIKRNEEKVCVCVCVCVWMLDDV
jgi:hypothetical protein